MCGSAAGRPNKLKANAPASAMKSTDNATTTRDVFVCAFITTASSNGAQMTAAHRLPKDAQFLACENSMGQIGVSQLHISVNDNLLDADQDRASNIFVCMACSTRNASDTSRRGTRC